MYKRRVTGWAKHLDFMLLDLVVVELSFLLAYFIRQGRWNLFYTDLYRECAVLLLFVNFIGALSLENHKNILKRDNLMELFSVLQAVALSSAVIVIFLFLLKYSANFSRLMMIWFVIVCTALLYIERVLWKRFVISRRERDTYNQRHLLVVTDIRIAEDALEMVLRSSLGEYNVIGVVLRDDVLEVGETVHDIPVVSAYDSLVDYMQDKWIDDVLFYFPLDVNAPIELLDSCVEMGITSHLRLNTATDRPGMHVIEKYGGCTVLTESLRIESSGQMFLKRAMDIAGGVVGLIFTGILILFVGPAIYFADPGPIFFSQQRVGQNGRVFKIYKFRSMYQDAEERKAALMAHNTIKDGLMFKMDDDPRILGSGPDGKRHGIGWFIRKTSIDEFPQFLNVLRGELSLVGTRPPTLDEWKNYDRHHRARMATRPGLTGLWQISGRSEIKDFEEVIALDLEYINNWSIWKDIQIILKTVAVIFTGKGAE